MNGFFWRDVEVGQLCLVDEVNLNQVVGVTTQDQVCYSGPKSLSLLFTIPARTRNEHLAQCYMYTIIQGSSISLDPH